MKRHTYAKLAAVCILVFAVLGLAGCSGGASSGGASSGGTTITEQNFTFSPANATVKAGDTVTFKNSDSAPHNVKIDGKELGVQQPGESKTWTASKDGSYPYACVIHPSMTGQITVGAGGTTTAPTGGTTTAPTGGTGSGTAPPAGTGGY